jgi:hypothetical protein
VPATDGCGAAGRQVWYGPGYDPAQQHDQVTMRRFLTVAVACGVALWCVPAATGDVIIDNLSQPVNSQDAGLTNAGDVFTTGAAGGRLQDVVLLLNGNLGGSLSDVGLFSSVGGLPGSELVSFGAFTPNLAGDNPYTLTPLAPFTLTAATQYILLVAYVGAPVLDYTFSTSYTGSGTIDEFTNSGDGGATYTDYPIGLGPYQMRIDVVPEPSSLALLALGFAGIAGLTRRRRFGV